MLDMIKIFRNIRRRLLGENRFTRYILYAIGEIILVVIGILIAVKINNYNSSENNKKYEAEIVSLLLEDLAFDYDKFTHNEEHLTNGVKKLRWINEHCSGKTVDSLKGLSPGNLLEDILGGFTSQSQFLLSLQLHPIKFKSIEINRSITRFMGKHAEIVVDIENHNFYATGEFGFRLWMEMRENYKNSKDYLSIYCKNDDVLVKLMSLDSWKQETLTDIRELLEIKVHWKSI
ncbi:hypothetical protein C7S20_09120 [Christiangramia fulva]|uniref:Uncharacterized protein n=1 Tax=Christiangramia fulva TaxID=2126553 RepID=A0A2R3Z585_9FLAO|nr:DUF6090 family protein [Christiangramia fulva]AVR45419.1 hypothetical protein C7S20_09120 [Christiangramia fulva]